MDENTTPAKRQKLGPSNSPSLNNNSNCEHLRDAEGNSRRLKTELVTIRARLSQSEITSVCLNNVRREIEEIHEREKIVLQMQVKSDTEMIEQLLGDLEVARMRAREAREAQVAAESKTSQFKIKMGKKVAEMWVKVNRLKGMIPANSKDSSASSNSQEDDPEGLKTKLEAAETRIIQLEKENLVSQNQLEQAKMTIQKFNSEKSLWEQRETFLISRTKDLEEQLESLKNVISTLSEAVKEKDYLERQISKYKDKFEGSASNEFSAASKNMISRYQQTDSNLMDEGGLRSRVDDLEKKLEELERKTEEALKMEENIGGINNRRESDVELIEERCPGPATNGIPGQVSDQEQSLPLGDKPDDVSVGITETGPPKPLRLIEVGTNYFVLPSDQKFFKINWKGEYRREGTWRYVCKRCQSVELNRTKMEDHVWVAHYGGSFKCPTCYVYNPFPLASRKGIRSHWKQFHPHLFQSKKSI